MKEGPDWKGLRPKDLPSFSVCLGAWQAAAPDELGSSEVENVKPSAPRVSKKTSTMAKEMEGLKAMFEESGSEDEDEEDDVEEPPRGHAAASGSHLPPGGRPGGRKEKDLGKKTKGSGEDLDVKKLLATSLAQGQSPSELMPLMMMSLLVQGEKKKKKGRRDEDDVLSLGGSSSDDSVEGEGAKDTGMKAVSTLHRLHRRIKTHPKEIYMLFEKDVVEELGVIPGQAWTVRDYLKKQPWGKFKGLYRCAVMDAVVYELMRSGQTEAATAQMVQNMKAKMQAVIQGGDWASAWLLTGIPDPLVKKEFAGTKQEMAVVSGYLEALHKLRKKVKESGRAPELDEEEEDHGTKPGKK